MATEVPAEDDDAWLYGDNNTEDQRKEEINAIFERATEEVPVPGEESPILPPNGSIKQDIEATENGEDDVDRKEPVEGNEEKDSDEDEDSDDDVQITIGDIKPSTTGYPYGGTPVNLNIKRGSAFSSGGGVGSSIKSKGIDIETIGVINGVSIYEFNLDSIEDKPWRKPGADITDYFNYGFNEDSWKAYCEKQRKLRLDNNVSVKAQVVPGTGKDQQIPIATVNENSKYSGFGIVAKKAGPPPGRRMSGSIDVICGANSANRRGGNAKENVIQVMTGRGDSYDGAVPGLPLTHIPPPFIPPNLSVPPPGLPPGIPPPSIPPPGHVPYPDLYGNPIFTQPPPPVPGVSVDGGGHQYDEQFFTGQSTHAYDNNSESAPRSWTNSPRDRDVRERHRDRSRDKDRDREHYWERDHERENRPGRPQLSEEEYAKRREEYERRRYREYRERREKDRYEREHERDYHERDKERDDRRDSREKDRERERKHREYKDAREERHREKDRSSRRRHHHEDEDDHHSSSSSRHKHVSKKTKRDKDESTPSTADVSDSTSQQEPDADKS